MAEICLVTGGSRGIGKAICEALGSAGCLVVGTATTSEGAQAITDFLNNLEIPGRGYRLDVRDQESVDQLLGDIETEYGPVSVLVNNAGITGDNLLLRMKEQDWDGIIDTNLKSLYRLSKAVLRKMTKTRHGRIINIGSVVGSTGNAGQTNYAAAKAGIIMMTKVMAQELAESGIRVNAICPGIIKTGLTDWRFQMEARLLNTTFEKRQAEHCQHIPLKRLGTIAEVAGLVCFLASNESSFITGQALNITGGQLMEL